MRKGKKLWMNGGMKGGGSANEDKKLAFPS